MHMHMHMHRTEFSEFSEFSEPLHFGETARCAYHGMDADGGP